MGQFILFYRSLMKHQMTLVTSHTHKGKGKYLAASQGHSTWQCLVTKQALRASVHNLLELGYKLAGGLTMSLSQWVWTPDVPPEP